MKTVLLCLTALTMCLPALAQPVIEWEHTYGDTACQTAQAIAETSDGGYIVAGERWTCGWSSGDLLLLRLAASGDTLWTRQYPISGNDFARAVLQTSDGGFLVAGRRGANGDDGWVIKTDSAGDTLWTRQFGGPSTDEFAAALETADGGYLLAGHILQSSTYCDGWLVKLTASGDTAWTRVTNLSGEDHFDDIKPTPDGGYILTGLWRHDSNYYPLWLYKVDANGDSVWCRHYDEGNSAIDHGAAVCVTSDSGFVVAGYHHLTNQNVLAALRTDAAGNPLWRYSYGDAAAHGCGVAPLPNGDFVLVGGSSYNVEFSLIRLNADGDNLTGLSRTNVYAYTVITTRDSGYAVAGFQRSGENEDDDVWVAKFAPDSVIPSSAPPVFVPPSAFNLSAYPNPFNPTTRISFALPEAGKVKLEVFDMLGQCVATLRNGFLGAGEHVEVLDGWTLSAGVHFARLTTPHRQATLKLVLIK